MNHEKLNIPLDTLAEDARALLTATANVAEDQVVAARKRLSAVLDRAHATCDDLKDKTVETAKVADQALHEHPYQAIGIAFGIGALLAFLLTRRN